MGGVVVGATVPVVEPHAAAAKAISATPTIFHMAAIYVHSGSDHRHPGGGDYPLALGAASRRPTGAGSSVPRHPTAAPDVDLTSPDTHRTWS